MVQDSVDDQHVREAQGDARVGDGRAEAADQVRGSLACSVHGRTIRRGGRQAQDEVSAPVLRAVFGFRSCPGEGSRLSRRKCWRLQDENISIETQFSRLGDA